MVKLYNDDCLNIFKNIPDSSIDLICTDPPYKIMSRGNSGNAGGMFLKDINMKGKVFDHNSISVKEYAPEFYRVLKDGKHMYVMTNHINLIEMLNTFTDAGFHFIKNLIWDKGNKIMGAFYMSQYEYVMFFRKGHGYPIRNCGTSDILRYPNIKQSNGDEGNFHDTEKPVDLMKCLIENSTDKGDIVLDPFMGIGSTGVAANQSERDFIGIEIDKKYFDVAECRIKENGFPQQKNVAQLW